MKKNKSFTPFRNHQFPTGFTIIELLIVIAIIGLISSIVFVSFKETREKARIAKALQFSQSVSHGLGAYAVGIWGFDDGSGTTANDSSGYGNNGTINGANWVTGILGTALNFDGTNDYVRVPDSASLDITDAITLEAWVYPKQAKEQYYISKGSISGADKYRAGFQVPGGVFKPDFFLNLSTGEQDKLGAAISGLNKWYHLVMTYDGSAMRIYRDGELTNVWTGISGTITTDNFPLDIGTRFQGGYYFNGLLDEVHIYNKALGAVQIQKHYTEGLESHKDLAIK